MRSALKFRTVVRLIDDVGRQWVLSGPPSMPSKGVTLLPDTSGLADVQFDILTAQSARSRGDVFVSKVRPPRSITLPLLLDGEGSAVRLSAIRKELYASLTRGPVTLALWTPTKGDRWAVGTVTNIADQSGSDIYPRNQTQILDVEITAHDPLWHSYPHRQQVVAPSATSSSWRRLTTLNDGEVSSYPKVAVTTRTSSTLELRYQDHRNLPVVTRLPAMLSGESYWIDFDPAERPLFSDKRGGVPWGGIKARDIPLPPGPLTGYLDIRSVVNNRAFTATVFTPQLHEVSH